LAATLDRKKYLTDKKLRIAFDFFDKDGSGKIDFSELKQVMGNKKKLVSDQVFMDIIKEVDEDGDMEVSFFEFSNMMEKLVKVGF